MSAKLRCPECGSQNADCSTTRKTHIHRCLDCGYRGESPRLVQVGYPLRCEGGYKSIDQPILGGHPPRAACPSCGRMISFHKFTGRFARHFQPVGA